MEPVTTVGLSAIAAYLGKDGLQKLPGPTADYLGGGLKDFTEKRFEAVGKIFRRASEKLGNELNENAAVPPKVLKHIIDDGSFATDDIEIEYLAGVLASSRSETERDNRGASIAKLVDSLSNYQIRAHYVLYTSLRAEYSGRGFSVNMEGRPKMKSFIDFQQFILAMDFSKREILGLDSLLSHILFGLHKSSLVEDFLYGNQADLMKSYPSAPGDGIVFQPSMAGIELYLWVFGAGERQADHFLSPAFVPDSKLQISSLTAVPMNPT